MIEALKKKFPKIVGPHAQDICYATENRQTAVKNVAHGADLVLVVGSRNSSNSNRLVEVSMNLGTTSYLIDKAEDIRRSGWRTLRRWRSRRVHPHLRCWCRRLSQYLQERGLWFGR